MVLPAWSWDSWKIKSGWQMRMMPIRATVMDPTLVRLKHFLSHMAHNTAVQTTHKSHNVTASPDQRSVSEWENKDRQIDRTKRTWSVLVKTPYRRLQEKNTSGNHLKFDKKINTQRRVLHCILDAESAAHLNQRFQSHENTYLIKMERG